MATNNIILPIPPVFDVSNPCRLKYANNRARLLFDASTAQIGYYTFRMPSDYASGPILRIQYAMTSATSGAIRMGCAIAAITPGDAVTLAAKTFATENFNTSTVPGTAGYVKEVAITLTNADSLAAGDLVTLRVKRDAADAGDTATGDAEIVAITLEYQTL